MAKPLKIAVILLFIALTPLKGVAALTIGFCGGNHSHSAPAEPSDSSNCVVCVEHCGNSSLLCQAWVEVGPLAQRTEGAGGAAAFFAGDILERLDRPPLFL